MDIPIGPDHKTEPIANVRSAEQRATAANLINEPHFDYADNNPFKPGGYEPGPIVLIWTDRWNQRHLTQIATNGEIMGDLEPPRLPG